MINIPHASLCICPPFPCHINIKVKCVYFVLIRPKNIVAFFCCSGAVLLTNCHVHLKEKGRQGRGKKNSTYPKNSYESSKATIIFTIVFSWLWLIFLLKYWPLCFSPESKRVNLSPSGQWACRHFPERKWDILSSSMPNSHPFPNRFTSSSVKYNMTAECQTGGLEATALDTLALSLRYSVSL